jgi:hypothetical protein
VQPGKRVAGDLHSWCRSPHSVWHVEVGRACPAYQSNVNSDPDRTARSCSGTGEQDPADKPALRYFHRNLNPPKLVDIGFAHLPRTSTISRMVRQYAVPQHPRIPGFREMVKADVPQVGELLRKYLARFEVVQVFAKDEEVEHWFLSGQGREEGGKRVEQVVWAYVVEVGWQFSPKLLFATPKHVVIYPKVLPETQTLNFRLLSVVPICPERDRPAANPCSRTGPNHPPHHRLYIILLAPFFHHEAQEARRAQRRLPVLLRLGRHFPARGQLR